MTKEKIDETLLKNIKDKTESLEGSYAQLHKDFASYEKMYLLNWEDEKPTKSDIKLTVSPQPRNAANGMVRLLVATDPQINIPYEKNDAKSKEASEKLEKISSALLFMAGRARKMPLHYDIVRSGTIYGEAHLVIKLTEDMLAMAKDKNNKSAMKRLEKLANTTPIVYDVINPKFGYPEFTDDGLQSFFRKTSMTGSKILDAWGERARKLGLDDSKRFDNYDYCEYWDNAYRVSWIDGVDGVLWMGEHDLITIPVVAQIIEGSLLFDEKLEYTRQPLLYTSNKSQIWYRQNLAQTVFWDNVFTLGNNGSLVYEANQPGKKLEIDNSVKGGVINIQTGEKLYSLAQEVLSPVLLQGIEMADGIMAESTLYKQTFGEPLGSNAPFSMVSLLSHMGRLPLVCAQRLSGWAIAEILEKSFEILKDQGGSKKVYSKREGQLLEIKAAEIPDNIIIECDLDINMPQDERQNATIAGQLASGEDPITSKRYVREKVLNIGQSEEMEKEIAMEMFLKAELQMELQKKISELQMKFQQAAQQPQQGIPQQMPGQPQLAAQPGIPAGEPMMPQNEMPMGEPGEEEL